MEFIKDRKEMAKVLNFGKYPVVKLDLANRDEYGFKGATVRIDMGEFNDGEKFYQVAELRVFTDTKIVEFMAGGACLTKDFGYHDFAEMVDGAVAPIIKPNSEFALAVYDSEVKGYIGVAIVKTLKTIKFCMTPLLCGDADMSELIDLYYGKEA